MKSLRALLIPVIVFSAPVHAAQVSRWDKFKDVGWTAHDQLNRTRLAEIQRLLNGHINKTWEEWAPRPYDRLGELRDSLPAQISTFMGLFIAAFGELDAHNRAKLMNILQHSIGGLFGSKTLDDDYKKALEEMKNELDALGKQSFDAGNVELASSLGGMAIVFERRLAQSGQSKKQAEAKAAIPPKNPAGDPEQERASLQFYVSVYLKQVDAGVSEELRQRAFQMATTGISNLNLPEEEKDAAVDTMLAATPQEVEQAAPAKRATQPSRPSISGQVQPRPSVSEQPKRATELKKVEAPKRAAPAAPARPSIVEEKMSGDDKEKLVLIKSEFWRGALSNDADIREVAVADAREKISKLATLPEQRKKDIVAYMEWVIKQPEGKRALEQRRQMGLDVLDPQAWKK